MSKLNLELIGEKGLKKMMNYLVFSTQDGIFLDDDYQLDRLASNYLHASIDQGFKDIGFYTDSISSLKDFLLCI
eukprot:CAMPEP_0170480182 /NCGR_PEP_ID=MMETSP0208-20121228/1124_1 /TAXON_ID=197538 /ORGANISM="Strombidium inclinatum, Strain S3" /LENGTH=73 /DNA_ID=CAMNT_0010752689 /DNA_START=2247 /DNA_END=2468 /DNA_ORIENTATION=+